MAKLYTENSLQKTENIKPKQETIKFLLDYSKALKIENGKHGEYEMLLN